MSAPSVAADALEGGTDNSEDEAFRRAHDGTAEPVISAGRVVVDDKGEPVVIQHCSDALLTLLLKAKRPDRCRDRISADLRADVKVASNPEADFVVMVALLDGLASRKAADLRCPELDAPATLPK